MKISKFEEIESWKVAKELVLRVYTITKTKPFMSDYGLKDQIQRAVVSIMANIAEGFGCNSKKSFINFLNISYRSACEVQCLLYVALDLKYVTKEDFDFLYSDLEKVKGLIGGLTRYLKNAIA